jgi:hypothetical protein
VVKQPPALQPVIPLEIATRLAYLDDRARGMGVRLVASRGAGKSRMLGRVIAWLDLQRATPLVILDPIGSVIDNLLDKLVRLSQTDQERLWSRIRYVDLAGHHGHVVPMPLLYRVGDESLYEIAQRPLDVFRKSDPALIGASVLGWNAVAAIGTRVGMALAAMELQLTEAPALLDNPRGFEARLLATLPDHPDLAPVVDYFLRIYPALSAREREQQTLSFRRKIDLFQLDPTARAQYGADLPEIDWQRVVDERQCVLLDCRHLFDPARKKFAILWVYAGLLEWIKRRGPGRHRPLSLIVDEITYLLGDKYARTDPLIEDMEELLARLARNHSIWLTFAHQEVNQLSDRINYLLMTCNQIFGSTADVDAALAIARRFDSWDPHWVKKREKVWASDRESHFVIDERSTEYSIPEQDYLNSRHYLELPRFTFLVGLCQHEGSLPTSLRRISIANFDPGLYVQEELVAEARRRLAVRDGRPIGEVLTEITARSSELTAPSISAQRTSASPVAAREPLT